jgi:hypothetical protein
LLRQCREQDQPTDDEHEDDDQNGNARHGFASFPLVAALLPRRQRAV